MPMLTVRCTDAELRRWKQAAGEGRLSAVVRELLDRHAVTAGRSSRAVDEAVGRAVLLTCRLYAAMQMPSSGGVEVPSSHGPETVRTPTRQRGRVGRRVDSRP
jgi:hypothetical protein